MNDDKPKKLYPYDTILPDKPVNVKPPAIMATEKFPEELRNDIIDSSSKALMIPKEFLDPSLELDNKLTSSYDIGYEKIKENFYKTMAELLLGNMPEDTKTKYTEVVTAEALDKLNYELITKDKITKKVKDKLKDLDIHAPLKDLSLEDKKLLIKAINEELEEFNMEVYIFEDKLFIMNVPNHQYIRYTIK